MAWSSIRFKPSRRFSIIFLTAHLIVRLPLAISIAMAISLVLRLVVKIIAAVCRPDLHQLYKGKGMIFALESICTHPKTNILVYLFCDNGPMPLEQFRLQFEQRVLNYTDDRGTRPYEKLAQTWTSFMGFLFWKWDSNFKLDNHIRLYDYTDPELAVPGKCNEDDLKRIAGDLMTQPWIEGQSPWEILIVQNYRTTKDPQRTGSVAILRIHHGMIDGYSILTMVLKFTDSLDVKRILPNFPKLSLPQRILRPLLVLLKMPYDIAEFAVNSCDGPNCWHFPWNRLTRKYHVFFSDEIDVEKIKKIRKKYGASYNATVYSIGCGCIRRMMLDAGQKLPSSMSAGVPFPLPNHPGGLANHAASTGFKFYPRSVSAKDRIRQVGDNMKKLQGFPTGPTSNHWLAEVAGLFPTCLFKLGSHVSLMTMVMSSIPGPEVGINFVGDVKCTEMCVVLGLGEAWNKVGAIASMTTMNGKQMVTLTVDKAIFEGYKVPTRFAEFINYEIEALLNENETHRSSLGVINISSE